MDWSGSGQEEVAAVVSAAMKLRVERIGEYLDLLRICYGS